MTPNILARPDRKATSSAYEVPGKESRRLRLPHEAEFRDYSSRQYPCSIFHPDRTVRCTPRRKFGFSQCSPAILDQVRAKRLKEEVWFFAVHAAQACVGQTNCIAKRHSHCVLQCGKRIF